MQLAEQPVGPETGSTAEYTRQLTEMVTSSVLTCLTELLGRGGWRVMTLAAELDVSAQTLRNWRMGRIREPHLYAVARLHQLARRSLTLGWEPGTTAPAGPEPVVPVSEMKALITEQVNEALRAAGVTPGDWPPQRPAEKPLFGAPPEVQHEAPGVLEAVTSLRNKLDALQQQLESASVARRRA